MTVQMKNFNQLLKKLGGRMNANNFFFSDENKITRTINLQVGVVGVIRCLNDNIGEVGEAIGEDIGRKVMLGLGL